MGHGERQVQEKIQDAGDAGRYQGAEETFRHATGAAWQPVVDSSSYTGRVAAHPQNGWRVMRDIRRVLRRSPYLKALFQIFALFSLVCSMGAAASEQGDNVMVEMTTSKGVITLELDVKKAPLTVANFLEYVNSGHYDGTIFHRVIPGFVIQGWDKSGMRKKPPGPRLRTRPTMD